MTATYYYQPKKNKAIRIIKKIFLWLLAIVAVAGIFYISFFSYKLYSVGKKINPKNESGQYSFIKTLKNIASTNTMQLKNSNGRINILLLGIAGERKPGQYLADTIMVASLDLQKGRVALLSLPRDLYAKVSGTEQFMKINSIYSLGINASEDADPIKETVEEITSLELNYYAVLNFDGFEKIIDSIGGINIMNQRNIFDPRYPGPNYSYETFELAKGLHKMDGATALKYARVRHGDPEGDFGRAKRQQQVLQATKNKIFSTGTYLDAFALNDLFNALEDNISTDIRPEEIGEFLRTAKALDTQNIINVVADAWNKDSLLKVSHIFYGNTRSFILVPRVGNWSELQDLAQNIFELDSIKKRQAEIEKEDASILILNRSGDKTLADKIKPLLKDKLFISTVNILTERERHISNETIAIDKTEGKKIFTLDELIKKLPARLDKSNLNIVSPHTITDVMRSASCISPSQNYSSQARPCDINGEGVNLTKETDIVLILGQDLIKAHSFEEDSIEEYNKAENNFDA